MSLKLREALAFWTPKWIRTQTTEAVFEEPVSEFGRSRRGRKKYCWEPLSDFQAAFEEENGLAETITEYVELHVPSVPGEDRITLSLYMVGESLATSVPTVMFISKSERSGQNARKAIKDSDILRQYPAFHTAYVSRDPGTRNAKFLASGESFQPEALTAAVATQVLFDPSQPILPLGNTIFIRHGDSLRAATANVMRMGELLLFQTVFHAFRDGALEFGQDDADDELVIDCDTDSEDEFDEDAEVAITSTGSRSPDQWSLQSSSSGASSPRSFVFSESSTPRLVEVEPSQSSGIQLTLDRATSRLKPFVTRSSALPSTCSPHTIENSLVPLGKLIGSLPERDWALIEITDSTVVRRLQELAREPSCLFAYDKVAENPQVNADVYAFTASGGRISGVLSGATSYTRLVNGTSFQKTYKVRLHSTLANGDCGSAIIDATTGATYGHLVLGCETTGIAYILAARQVAEDSVKLTNWDMTRDRQPGCGSSSDIAECQVAATQPSSTTSILANLGTVVASQSALVTAYYVDTSLVKPLPILLTYLFQLLLIPLMPFLDRLLSPVTGSLRRLALSMCGARLPAIQRRLFALAFIMALLHGFQEIHLDPRLLFLGGAAGVVFQNALVRSLRPKLQQLQGSASQKNFREDIWIISHNVQECAQPFYASVCAIAVVTGLGLSSVSRRLKNDESRILLRISVIFITIGHLCYNLYPLKHTAHNILDNFGTIHDRMSWGSLATLLACLLVHGWSPTVGKWLNTVCAVVKILWIGSLFAAATLLHRRPGRPSHCPRSFSLTCCMSWVSWSLAILNTCRAIIPGTLGRTLLQSVIQPPLFELFRLVLGLVSALSHLHILVGVVAASAQCAGFSMAATLLSRVVFLGIVFGAITLVLEMTAICPASVMEVRYNFQRLVLLYGFSTNSLSIHIGLATSLWTVFWTVVGCGRSFTLLLFHCHIYIAAVIILHRPWNAQDLRTIDQVETTWVTFRRLDRKQLFFWHSKAIITCTWVQLSLGLCLLWATALVPSYPHLFPVVRIYPMDSSDQKWIILWLALTQFLMGIILTLVMIKDSKPALEEKPRNPQAYSILQVVPTLVPFGYGILTAFNASLGRRSFLATSLNRLILWIRHFVEFTPPNHGVYRAVRKGTTIFLQTTLWILPVVLLFLGWAPDLVALMELFLFECNPGHIDFTTRLLVYPSVIWAAALCRWSESDADDCACDRIWRLVIGFGAFPSFLALLFRITMAATFHSFRDVVDEDHRDTTSDKQASTGATELLGLGSRNIDTFVWTSIRYTLTDQPNYRHELSTLVGDYTQLKVELCEGGLMASWFPVQERTGLVMDRQADIVGSALLHLQRFWYTSKWAEAEIASTGSSYQSANEPDHNHEKGMYQQAHYDTTVKSKTNSVDKGNTDQDTPTYGNRGSHIGPPSKDSIMQATRPDVTIGINAFLLREVENWKRYADISPSLTLSIASTVMQWMTFARKVLKICDNDEYELHRLLRCKQDLRTLEGNLDQIKHLLLKKIFTTADDNGFYNPLEGPPRRYTACIDEFLGVLYDATNDSARRIRRTEWISGSTLRNIRIMEEPSHIYNGRSRTCRVRRKGYAGPFDAYSFWKWQFPEFCKRPEDSYYASTQLAPCLKIDLESIRAQANRHTCFVADDNQDIHIRWLQEGCGTDLRLRLLRNVWSPLNDAYKQDAATVLSHTALYHASFFNLKTLDGGLWPDAETESGSQMAHYRGAQIIPTKQALRIFTMGINAILLKDVEHWKREYERPPPSHVYG